MVDEGLKWLQSIICEMTLKTINLKLNQMKKTPIVDPFRMLVTISKTYLVYFKTINLKPSFLHRTT